MEVVLQYIINGLMLGIVYALVAVGFTLFFGVLNVIVFSHGDTVMIGAFAGMTSCVWILSSMPDAGSIWLVLGMIVLSVVVVGIIGILMARCVVMPLRTAPPLNTLLATMMVGTVLREAIRLFYPGGSTPQSFPKVLPDWSWGSGVLNIRFDNVVIFVVGVVLIVAVHLLITRTRLGMAIRAVAQDVEAAQMMGVNFPVIVVTTFLIGSTVAAFAGLMDGMYYSEINFNMGVLLGAIGFAAAVIGGLGNIYGAILGGLIFAFLQVIGAIIVPVSSAYKDVFAFGVVIVIMAWRPTGILAEPSSQRV